MASVDIGLAWRRGQKGWPRRFVLVQFPNPPLILALTGLAAAAFTNGTASSYAEAVGRIGLAVFGYLELTAGANWLRRVIGAGVLVALVHALAQSGSPG